MRDIRAASGEATYGSRLHILRSHTDVVFCVLPSVFPNGFSSKRQTACSLQSTVVVLFRVNCLNKFDVFLLSTIPFTANKHSVTSPYDIMCDVGKPNVGFRIKRPKYEPWISYILGVKTLNSHSASVHPRLSYIKSTSIALRGAVASWLVRSTPDRMVQVQALAGDIVLCSWARHFTLTLPLSTQVYKWVPANLMLGVTLRWTSIPSRGK